jgi:predicted MFS family arabinose efflux permease
MSLNSSSIRLGQTLGPPVMALPYSIGSFNAVYFFSAALALIMLIVAVISGRLIDNREDISVGVD